MYLASRGLFLRNFISSLQQMLGPNISPEIIYFLAFWIIELNLNHFENRVSLKPVLEGMSSVATSL